MMIPRITFQYPHNRSQQPKYGGILSRMLGTPVHFGAKKTAPMQPPRDQEKDMADLKAILTKEALSDAVTEAFEEALAQVDFAQGKLPANVVIKLRNLAYLNGIAVPEKLMDWLRTNCPKSKDKLDQLVPKLKLSAIFSKNTQCFVGEPTYTDLGRWVAKGILCQEPSQEAAQIFRTIPAGTVAAFLQKEFGFQMSTTKLNNANYVFNQLRPDLARISKDSVWSCRASRKQKTLDIYEKLPEVILTRLRLGEDLQFPFNSRAVAKLLHIDLQQCLAALQVLQGRKLLMCIPRQGWYPGTTPLPTPQKEDEDLRQALREYHWLQKRKADHAEMPGLVRMSVTELNRLQTLQALLVKNHMIFDPTDPSEKCYQEIKAYLAEALDKKAIQLGDPLPNLRKKLFSQIESNNRNDLEKILNRLWQQDRILLKTSEFGGAPYIVFQHSNKPTPPEQQQTLLERHGFLTFPQADCFPDVHQRTEVRILRFLEECLNATQQESSRPDKQRSALHPINIQAPLPPSLFLARQAGTSEREMLKKLYPRWRDMSDPLISDWERGKSPTLLRDPRPYLNQLRTQAHALEADRGQWASQGC